MGQFGSFDKSTNHSVKIGLWIVDPCVDSMIVFQAEKLCGKIVHWHPTLQTLSTFEVWAWSNDGNTQRKKAMAKNWNLN